MSDSYLLAAGLLAAGPISAPPPPLPPNWLESFRALFDAEELESLTTASVVAANPTVEKVEPEFSGLGKVAPLREWQPKVSSPSSGSQLYAQRRTALKAGQLYTRLSPGSFAGVWGKARQQPTHQQWKSLLAQEARAIAKGQGTNRLNVLVGDSLSLWFPSEFLPRGKFWLNQGISGENSGQIRQRVKLIDQTRPNTVYVMAGVNDLRQGADDATILNNIRAIARHLRKTHPESEIVLQSILPTRRAELSNARIRRLNRQIVQIAQQEGANYLNLHSLFTDEQGQMRPELTTDGLHLSREGYGVWQSAMQQAEDWLAIHNVR
ncbi:GDSL-type esterase/lipase family protein [Lusitaniella coriacea]|uniref:GDSL-type esterase/lipase family protein n=1 Tax=Lusitaniella coriacea TaxID=1983105 RepID=UPI003CF4988A